MGHTEENLDRFSSRIIQLYPAVTGVTCLTPTFLHISLILWFLVLNCNICLGMLYHSYEMLQLEEQLEIAHQVGTTRSQILSNLNDLSLGTSFL